MRGALNRNPRGYAYYLPQESESHARVILSFQQPTFQTFTKHQRFPFSHFKCCFLFQVNFWNVGCWNDCQTTLWIPGSHRSPRGACSPETSVNKHNQLRAYINNKLSQHKITNKKSALGRRRCTASRPPGRGCPPTRRLANYKYYYYYY